MERKETLKRIRIYLAMTQQQFADYIGVSKRTIEEWESGGRSPRDYVLDLIITKVRYDQISESIQLVINEIY